MDTYLFVGDPHAEPHDLKDAKQLAALIWGQAKAFDATVVIAGDLYHTHAIIHAEVQHFWWNFLEDLRGDNVRSILIKGNHDGPVDHTSPATALLTHWDQAVVVRDEPFRQDGILFCPYTSGEQLVKWAQEMGPWTNTLVCHQTFDGSKYENGFFAGDGVDPSLIPQKQIISGHIHTPQEFGKVWYPGAPRWRVLNDANVDRAIWVLGFENGNLVHRQPIDTGNVCRKIFHFVDTPASPVHVTPNAKDEYRVDIVGPQAWIDERLPLFSGWAKVRATRTDGRVDVKVRESEGVGVALAKFAEAYQPRYGTPKDMLNMMLKERVVL